MLSVVTLEKRPHRYGADLLAAPAAGRRAACAALLVAAGAEAKAVAVALTVEQGLGGRGLAAVGRLSGPFDETLIVTADDTSGAELPAELGRVTRLLLPVRYGGTAVETIALADVRALADRIRSWIELGR